MSPEFAVSRRTLLCGLSISVFAPDLLVALQHTHANVPANTPPAFDVPTAKALEILAEGILPGAREARVIDFIQNAVSTIFKDQRGIYEKGLAGLTEKLTQDNVESVLRSIETTPFFETLRTHTIMGYLVHPSWGGNKDLVGWKAIGFEDARAFQPPFGYYDDPKNAR